MKEEAKARKGLVSHKYSTRERATMEEKFEWFSMITERLRDYSDEEVWSDGSEILCKTESASEALADLLWQLYSAQGEEVTVVTGYYDPEEDRRNGEEDRYTGWWYVSIE